MGYFSRGWICAERLRGDVLASSFLVRQQRLEDLLWRPRIYRFQVVGSCLYAALACELGFGVEQLMTSS